MVAPSNVSSPKRGRRALRLGGAAAALLLALAVGGGIAVAALGGDDPPLAPAAQPSPSTSLAPATPKPDTSPAVSTARQTAKCAMPSGEVSLTQPPAARWEVFKGVALPYSTEAGPAEVRGEIARCYAHTAHGALIAAWQISVRMLLATDWRDVVRSQVLPGAGRDRYERSRAAITADLDAPGTLAQVAGYRVVHYSPQTAVVQLVTRTPVSRLLVTTATVRWADGDWRLVLHEDGGISPTVQQTDSLAGFIAWGGV